MIFDEAIIDRVLKNKNAIGQIINVGSGTKYNLKKVIKKIINISKGGVANYGKIKLRKDEIIEFYPSISKAKKILKDNKSVRKSIEKNSSGGRT